jgi:hypothetical protein
MKKVTLSVLTVLLVTSAAQAGPAIPIGFRVGYTGDEAKQIHFGGHARVAEIARNLAVQPSIELGFGDNTTLLAGNADLFYEFSELATSMWGFYAGGGVVLSYVNVDVPEGFDGSSTNVGLSVAGGARYNVAEGKHLMGEIRFGIEDAPDFKVTVGLTFF